METHFWLAQKSVSMSITSKQCDFLRPLEGPKNFHLHNSNALLYRVMKYIKGVSLHIANIIISQQHNGVWPVKFMQHDNRLVEHTTASISIVWTLWSMRKYSFISFVSYECILVVGIVLSRQTVWFQLVWCWWDRPTTVLTCAISVYVANYTQGKNSTLYKTFFKKNCGRGEYPDLIKACTSSSNCVVALTV